MMANMKKVIGGIGLAVCLGVGLAACGGSSASSNTLHIRLGLFNGTTGTDSDGNPQLVPGQPCYGADGDSDISSGASATVKNGNGSIIGSATLGNGSASGGVCYFDIPITVPTTGFYQVEIGSGHGSTTYTLAQLQKDNWHPPSLALGG